MRGSFSRLIVFALFISLFGGLAAIAQTPVSNQDTLLFEKLKVQLGADEGAALAILYGGDTRGNIDTCG